MYPYQFPCQGIYPFNQLACGNYVLPCMYPGYPDEYRSEVVDEEDEKLEDINREEDKESEDITQSEDARGQGSGTSQGNAQVQNQFGKGNSGKFPSTAPTQPEMTGQEGIMQPGMFAQPGVMPQLGPLQAGILGQDSFSEVIRQLQSEAPQILSSLISLGLAIETLRQSIIRIINAAEDKQK
ncbi:MAG TPA: hypothetical protein DD429_03985 [Clostridiaceae bacterium]|nr:hypothetical protein [Clostridiaceae bacterium]